ncbi:MAG: tetratricopeptide repeat protein, partial [Actinomycetota bacterium]|nr:tetratricopeptide repeat protein [Actinomycetota bacterium]
TEPCGGKGIRKTTASLPARVVDDVADALPQYALVAGLLLALFFTVLLLGYIGPVHARLVRLPGVRRILSPRLNMDALADKSGQGVGEAISARIGQRLTRMRDEAKREGVGHELDLGTPRESFADLVSRNRGLKSALDNASEIGDQAKIVAALLKLLYTLLPIRRLTVAGVVEPALGSRASATLSLERDGTLMAAATLHGSSEGSPSTDGPTAADYAALAEPAAVWVQYEVARAIEGGKEVSPDAAESYALVREGLRRQMAGEYDEARECYERARDLDPSNWAARLNLAMTEARLSGQYSRAVDLLDEAFTEIRRP